MYVLSKILEHFDQSVYAVTGFVSGHTLKHVLAAAGTGCIVIMLYKRKAELTDPPHGHGPQGAV
jgi:hypothetical protein